MYSRYPVPMLIRNRRYWSSLLVNQDITPKLLLETTCASTKVRIHSLISGLLPHRNAREELPALGVHVELVYTILCTNKATSC